MRTKIEKKMRGRANGTEKKSLKVKKKIKIKKKKLKEEERR